MRNEKFELYINYNTVFQVETSVDCGLMLNFIVTTQGFKGHGPIYIKPETLNDAITKLTDMINNLNGNLTLQDIESVDYYVEFRFEGSELVVEGILGDYSNNFLHFHFNADQTVLTLLLKVFLKLEMN